MEQFDLSKVNKQDVRLIATRLFMDKDLLTFHGIKADNELAGLTDAQKEIYPAIKEAFDKNPDDFLFLNGPFNICSITTSDDRKDDNFYETLYDVNGNVRRVLREQINVIHESSGFSTYDDSHGHCTFCGRLTCRGGCFK